MGSHISYVFLGIL